MSDHVMRVQIPAYAARWMMGDRYGNVVKVTRRKERYVGVPSSRKRLDAHDVAHVLLDKSSKIVMVPLADCEVVS